jgi:hypothetical protein
LIQANIEQVKDFITTRFDSNPGFDQFYQPKASEQLADSRSWAIILYPSRQAKNSGEQKGKCLAGVGEDPRSVETTGVLFEGSVQEVAISRETCISSCPLFPARAPIPTDLFGTNEQNQRIL